MQRRDFFKSLLATPLMAGTIKPVDFGVAERREIDRIKGFFLNQDMGAPRYIHVKDIVRYEQLLYQAIQESMDYFWDTLPNHQWRKVVSDLSIGHTPETLTSTNQIKGGFWCNPPEGNDLYYSMFRQGDWITIDDVSIHNDDIAIVRQVPKRLALISMHLLNSFVFKELILDQVESDSLALALSCLGLDTALKELSYRFSGKEGYLPKLVNQPMILVVAPELESTGQVISIHDYISTNKIEPQKQKVDVVVVPCITEVNAWILISNPILAPVIEMRFITEKPKIVSYPGRGYRIYFPWSGRLLERKSIFYSNP